MRKRSQRLGKYVLLSAVWGMTAIPASALADLTFTIGGTWDTDARKAAATAAMQSVVNRYNAYGNFGNYNVYVYYNAGIPTAQANYLGSIGFGGTYPNERVTMHELGHYLGSGTNGTPWGGAIGNAMVRQFDGEDAILDGDTQHFWPYGLNYDSEGSEINKQRQVAMIYAQRGDMGIGPTANASSATTVNLTADDALGESGFNYQSKWSDAHFAHSGAAYSTGNFALRTPADASSFKFVGESVTLNNTDTAKGLFYKGSGTTGIITFKNLVLDGGSIHHFSAAADLFQLGGKMTAASASRVTSEQGHTNLLAPVSGNGALTIGASSFFVRLNSVANTFTGNWNVLGRLQLSEDANQQFVVGASGVNNAIAGAAAQAVVLNGVFNLDLGVASRSVGDSWNLVSATNATYGESFAVNGFTYKGGQWSNADGFVFNPATGRLSVVAAPAVSRWSGNASAAFATDANWGAAPATGNTLIFGAAGAAGTTIVDNRMTPASHTLSGVTFDADAPAYTINAGTPGTSGFSLAGEMINRSANVQTINDGITVPFARTPITTFANGGGIVINSGIAGAGGIAKAGSGTVTLAGANLYSGGTRVDAGTLLLTGTLNGAGSLTLAGGTFTDSRSGSATQTVNGLNVYAGASTINTAGAGTLAVGAITRHVGGTVQFATLNGAVTTTAANTNGILGPWAFVGVGANTLYATSNGGTIAAYTSATVESGAGVFGGIPSGDTSTVNYTITPAATFSAMGLARNVNTIAYTGGTATQTSNTNTTLTINGLLNTGTGTLAIGGVPRLDVVIGAGRDLVIATMTGDVILYNSILEGATGPAALTKVGPGKLTLADASTYTGKTTIGAGTLQVGNGSFGATLASQWIVNNGTLVFNHSDAQTYNGTITGEGSLTKSGSGTLTLTGNRTSTGSISMGGGTLAFDGASAAGTISSLTMPANTRVRLNTTLTQALKINALAMTSTPQNPVATIDVTTRGLIIDYTGALGNLRTDTAARIKAARGTANASGVFPYTGQGITSTSAATNNAAAGFNQFAVAAINNADLTEFGLTAYSVFGGQSVDATSILVRYTYNGDANLDGKLDAVDYALLNQGFAGTIRNAGWLSGDFTGDGLINAADYAVLDFGILKQGAALGLGDPTAVPEPTGIAAIGLIFAMSARRSRKQK